MKNTVELLKAEDYTDFNKIITDSFSDDPLFKHLFKGKDSIQKDAFINYIFHNALYKNDVICGIKADGVLQGVALIEIPERVPISKLFNRIRILSSMFKMITLLSKEQVQFLNKYVKDTRSGLSHSKIHYLVMIGVRNDSQGKGIGKTLLNYTISLSEQSRCSRGVALDTELKENIGLYKHFGFILEKTINVQSLPIFCFMRFKSEVRNGWG